MFETFGAIGGLSWLCSGEGVTSIRRTGCEKFRDGGVARGAVARGVVGECMYALVKVDVSQVRRKC